MLRKLIKSFLTFASVVYKMFYYQRRTNLVTLSRRALNDWSNLLINKYSKVWLLFTVEFQELVEIFWETYRLNSREFFILTFRLQKRSFLYETGILPGFKFFTSHFSCGLSGFLFSFWIDWLRTKEPRFRGPHLKSRQMRWYTYIHTSSRFFENQRKEICSHLCEKTSKGTFLTPEKLQIHSNEGKGKEEKEEQGEGKKEKKKKQWLHS